MHFDTAVREARKRRNWTQEALARRAGLSRQAVNLLENGGGRMATFAAVEPYLALRIISLRPGTTLGARVRATRLAVARTVAEIAAKAGVSANTIGSVEGNRGSIASLTAVLQALAPRARIIVDPPQERPSASISDDQASILRSILNLHVPLGRFDLDPTYGRGGLYRGGVPAPIHRSDLNPRAAKIAATCASSLEFEDRSLRSVMFDPPFLIKTNTEGPPGAITEWFGTFPSIEQLYHWYAECLSEFYRVLKPKGILVFKCQDTVQDHRQHLTHVWIINAAERLGFYVRDLFVLGAGHRVLRANQVRQRHARKHHAYFLVLEKKKSLVSHHGRLAGFQGSHWPQDCAERG